MAEETVREYGAVPATIGVYKGKIVVGLDREQVGALANNPADPVSRAMKASVKGIPYAIVNGLNAGFTIAAILRCASIAGIRFMATGGIGGVSKGGELSMDVSADLEELMSLSDRMIILYEGRCSGEVTDIPSATEAEIGLMMGGITSSEREAN